MAVKNSTERFSSRVENYVRYRPGYPAAVVALLEKECGLSSDSTVADIASGTGIFTRLLLEHGNRVFGVEPNPDMRRAGEEFLAAYAKFVSVAGTAEATTLPEHSIDLLTAAQAAHWFDPVKARREFARILKPGGWCVFVWNERNTSAAPFMQAYEEVLQKFGLDYKDVRHEHSAASIEAFYAPSGFGQQILNKAQELDYGGIEGRLLSSSYMPQAGDPKYEEMLGELQRVFERFQRDGLVKMEYDTRVYYGKIDSQLGLVS